jgi:enolase
LLYRKAPARDEAGEAVHRVRDDQAARWSSAGVATAIDGRNNVIAQHMASIAADPARHPTIPPA